MNEGFRWLALSRPVVCLIVLGFYVTNAPSNLHLAIYVISAAFFLASSAILVEWIATPKRWLERLIWTEVAMASLLNFFGGLTIPGGPMPTLYAPILVSLALSLPTGLTRVPVLVVTGAWALSSTPSWLESSVHPLFHMSIYGGLLMFAAAVGHLIRSLENEKERSTALLEQVNQSQSALERAYRQLQESAASQQAMAVVEERQRLAREIHDSVAHQLTALIVQLQVARRLAEKTPEQATTTLEGCEATAREALQETRRAVRALHPSGLEQVHDADALERLGRDFGIATGIAVTVTADDGVKALPPDPTRVEHLYRIFQEALTNAHRHGKAVQVTARLSLEGSQLRLAIENQGAPALRLEPGVGLKSMEERAHALGGSVLFAPKPTGLGIHITIPIKMEVTA